MERVSVGDRRSDRCAAGDTESLIQRIRARRRARKSRAQRGRALPVAGCPRPRPVRRLALDFPTGDRTILRLDPAGAASGAIPIPSRSYCMRTSNSPWRSPCWRSAPRPRVAQERHAEEDQGQRHDHHRPPRRVDPVLVLRRQAAARRLRDGPVREDRRRGEDRAEDAEARGQVLSSVTSANRIPLMANGTIDLECGSTTNNLERQKQVCVHDHALRHRQPLRREEVVEHQDARPT